MPNLRTWIEAQLKRGYKMRDARNCLSIKGYPPAAAEIDKVNNSKKTAAYGLRVDD